MFILFIYQQILKIFDLKLRGDKLKKDKVKPIKYRTIIKNKTLGAFLGKHEEDEEESKTRY